jgi:two-component sensor histidine kinase
MRTRLFPTDRQFWYYHLGASALGTAVTLLTIALWSPLAVPDSAAIVVWNLPFTLAVLAFRWLYRERGWKGRPMGRLVAIAVVYGSAAAVLVAASVAALTLPFFWDDIAAYQAARDMPIGLRDYLVRTISSSSLQAQVFICAWIFIYIGFTGSRDARARELDNARLQTALRDAQLRSLSNQLNPHFLFNSLNNIRFMIHEDAAQADTMLVGLSEILRHSLRSDDRAKVRLGDEIDIIARYLDIVGIQLEARLRFTIDVPAALHDCLVPPLLLQMLVENAVKHGLEPLREGGALSLSATQQGDALAIAVHNDKPAVQARSGGTGIGVRNIEQRLALLYGGRATHEARDKGRHYEVRLTLPRELAA